MWLERFQKGWSWRAFKLYVEGKDVDPTTFASEHAELETVFRKLQL